MRVGIGYDIHKLVENRKLILAGIEIPFEKGLLGHSDADIVFHAIADSFLGAMAKGDIGMLFPDTDEINKDMDSSILLREVVLIVEKEGYKISNVDINIIAQRPRLSKYREEMVKNIARILNIPIDLVSVKLRTNEYLDAVGSGEAMISQAICLLIKEQN